MIFVQIAADNIRAIPAQLISDCSEQTYMQQSKQAGKDNPSKIKQSVNTIWLELGL